MLGLLADLAVAAQRRSKNLLYNDLTYLYNIIHPLIHSILQEGES